MKTLRALVGLVVLASSGCAVPTAMTDVDPRVARQVVPATVDEGLRAVEDRDNQRRLGEALDDPEVKAAQEELVAGFVDGSIATLTEPERADRIGAIASQYAGEMARSATSEASAELGSTVSGELGPAVETVLRENIGPGMGDALDDERLREALGSAARVMGREMVVGIHEGLAQVDAESPQGDSTWGRLSDLASQGVHLASWITWVLVAVVGLLAVWIVKLLAQAKKYGAEADRGHAEKNLLEEATVAAKTESRRGERRRLRRVLRARSPLRRSSPAPNGSTANPR